MVVSELNEHLGLPFIPQNRLIRKEWCAKGSTTDKCGTYTCQDLLYSTGGKGVGIQGKGHPEPRTCPYLVWDTLATALNPKTPFFKDWTS